MAEAPAYVVDNFTIHDKDVYRKYEKGFFPVLQKHGGSFHTYDDSTVTFEGSEPREGRMVILQFPSAEAATNWYNDPEYQDAIKIRQSASTGRVICVEGV